MDLGLNGVGDIGAPGIPVRERFGVLNYMPVGVVVVDRAYRVVFWNKCMESWTGVSFVKVEGEDIRIRYPKLSLPKYSARFEVVFAGGPPAIFSAHLHRHLIPAELPDKSLRVQHTTVSAVRGRGRNEYYAMLTIQDVTETINRLKDYAVVRDQALNEVVQRRKAEEALRRSEGKFRSLYEGSSEGILLLDKNWVIMEANPKALEMLGFDQEEIKGRNILELGCRAEPSKALLTRSNLDANVFRGEHGCLRKDGRTAYVNLSASRIGQDRIQVILVDMTEHRKMIQLREDVERIARHDLKSPLSGIIGLSQILLDDGGLNEEQLQILLKVRDSGEEMLGRINHTLDVFNMECGRYEFVPTEVDLLQVMCKVVLENEGLAKAMQVGIDLEAPEGDEPVLVMGEKVLCYNLFGNLVRNAIEGSQPGERALISFQLKPDSILVLIHNQGTVPERIRGSFFEKYATAGKPAGTGLGTYSAKLMTETQGGKISYETDPDKGTTLKVELPRPGGAG